MSLSQGANIRNAFETPLFHQIDGFNISDSNQFVGFNTSNLASFSEPQSVSYYHPSNIILLQNELIKEVYRRSKGEFRIGKQNPYHIMKVMDKVLCLAGCPDKEQMNLKVIDICAHRILSYLNNYKAYLKNPKEKRCQEKMVSDITTNIFDILCFD